MNAEGVAPIVTAEWLQTLLTALPVALAACWLVAGQLRLWRVWLWRVAGPEIRALAVRWRLPVQWRWTGWAVESPQRSVAWGGGLRGSTTTVRLVDRVETYPGFLDADAVERAVGELMASTVIDESSESPAPGR